MRTFRNTERQRGRRHPERPEVKNGRPPPVVKEQDWEWE